MESEQKAKTGLEKEGLTSPKQGPVQRDSQGDTGPQQPRGGKRAKPAGPSSRYQEQLPRYSEGFSSGSEWAEPGEPWNESEPGEITQSESEGDLAAPTRAQAEWQEVRSFCYNVWKLELGGKSLSQMAVHLVQMAHNCPGMLGDLSSRMLAESASLQGTEGWRDVLPLPIPEEVRTLVGEILENGEFKVKKAGLSGGAIRSKYRQAGVDSLVYSWVSMLFGQV